MAMIWFMIYELEMFVHGCQEQGINFTAVVHPNFIQGPTAYAPVTYEVHALPHVLCFARVCRSWLQSVNLAVGNRIMINIRRPLHVAQLRHDTVEWLHRPSEDRFRFRSPLIAEIPLLKVTDPLAD